MLSRYGIALHDVSFLGITLVPYTEPRNAHPTAETLGKLYRHFSCGVGQLLEYVPDEAVPKK